MTLRATTLKQESPASGRRRAGGGSLLAAQARGDELPLPMQRRSII
jgi:hypothetical protein